MINSFFSVVIAVARKNNASIATVAKDFNISQACLRRWLKIDNPSCDPLESVNREDELKAARRRIALLVA